MGSTGLEERKEKNAVAAAATVPSSSIETLALCMALLNDMSVLPVNAEKSEDLLNTSPTPIILNI